MSSFRKRLLGAAGAVAVAISKNQDLNMMEMIRSMASTSEALHRALSLPQASNASLPRGEPPAGAARPDGARRHAAKRTDRPASTVALRVALRINASNKAAATVTDTARGGVGTCLERSAVGRHRWT